MEMNWAEPPQKKIRTHGYWIEVAEQLKANPLQWAFFEVPSSPTIGSNFQNYKGFERRWVTRESGQKDVYIRYVGIGEK